MVCEAPITVWQCYRCWGQKKYVRFLISSLMVLLWVGEGFFFVVVVCFLQSFTCEQKHKLNFLWRVHYCSCPSWEFSPFVYIGPTGESFSPYMYLSTSLFKGRRWTVKHFCSREEQHRICSFDYNLCVLSHAGSAPF